MTNKPLKDWEVEFDDFLTDCEAYSTFDGNNPFDLEKMKYVWKWAQDYKAKAVAQFKSQIVEQMDNWWEKEGYWSCSANEAVDEVLKKLKEEINKL